MMRERDLRNIADIAETIVRIRGERFLYPENMVALALEHFKKRQPKSREEYLREFTDVFREHERPREAA